MNYLNLIVTLLVVTLAVGGFILGRNSMISKIDSPEPFTENGIQYECSRTESQRSIDQLERALEAAKNHRDSK